MFKCHNESPESMWMTSGFDKPIKIELHFITVLHKCIDKRGLHYQEKYVKRWNLNSDGTNTMNLLNITSKDEKLHDEITIMMMQRLL